jgi:serine/threonine protein kinase
MRDQPISFYSIEITKAHFNFLFPIGRGGFGKVWRVESKKVKGETFAMKEMCKARVMAKKSVPSVMNELKLLS